jgi:hypothetical protein
MSPPHPSAIEIRLEGLKNPGNLRLDCLKQRLLKLKGWKDAERLVIGGGFRGRRVGELAIGRASVLLKAEKIKVEITTIHNEPDEAGLLV